MSDTIIISNLVKKYPEASHPTIKDLSLEIQQGEFFCLVGPSGCGKSTLLKLLIGIDQPSSGSIQTSGEGSMVFQSGALLPWLTVLENASFGLKMKGISESQAKQTAHTYLEMVGLGDFLKKYPRELSGGQKQRVGIARALSMETPILLLDEPFSALDVATTQELHLDLLKIWQQTNKTILMVSHLIEEAVTLADRVGVMTSGEIKHILEINLPRPRDEKSEAFEQLVKKISSLLN